MMLGSIVIGLIFGFSNIASTATAKAELTTCLKRSLYYSTPPDRDEARQECLSKERNLDLSKCMREAQRMEYLLNEQISLRECYNSRPQFHSMPNCLNVAKKLHTITDRDGMRLDCVSQMGLPKGAAECLNVAKSFEQTLYKKRIVRICLEN